MTLRTARLFVPIVICLFITAPISLVSAEDLSGGGNTIVNAGAFHVTEAALPLLNAYCDATAVRSPACFFPQPEHGVELKAERQADGTWQVMAMFEMPIDDGR